VKPSIYVSYDVFSFSGIYFVGGKDFKVSWKKTEPLSIVEVTEPPKGFSSHSKICISIGSLELVIL